MRIFVEEQRFTQWWVQAILISTMAVIAISIWQGISELSNENSNDGYIPIFVGIPTLVLMVLIGYFLKLKTKIDESGIHYGFYPFHFNLKHIPWNEIENVYVRKYSPIGEYGGWGYRISFGKHGKAYNVSGNKGIQIIFKDGNRTLIGTKKAEEAGNVLKTHQSKFKKDENI